MAPPMSQPDRQSGNCCCIWWILLALLLVAAAFSLTYYGFLKKTPADSESSDDDSKPTDVGTSVDGTPVTVPSKAPDKTPVKAPAKVPTPRPTPAAGGNFGGFNTKRPTSHTHGGRYGSSAAKPSRPWIQFDSTGKGSYIALGKSANGWMHARGQDGTVRAGPPVAREGQATATIRVDNAPTFQRVGPNNAAGSLSGHKSEIGIRITSQSIGSVQIGVVAENYTDWDKTMFWSSQESRIWFYGYPQCTHNGYIEASNHTKVSKTPEGYIRPGDIGPRVDGLPPLHRGSEVTVTLNAGTVTFLVKAANKSKARKVHSFELPQNCGEISLAVSLLDTSVTLL